MNAIVSNLTSRPLDDRYRPRRPQDLIGQPEAIRLFGEHVDNARAPAFLLHGPPGVGKTSWAEMLALARNCDSVTDKPCGNCKSCRGGINRMHFYDFSAARWDGVDVAKHVETLMTMAPWGNFGIFIDEVHALQPRAADVILKEVETPRPGRYFICATTELESVRPALRSRCIKIPFRPVASAEMYGLAQRICGEERITFEPAALDILVGQARGSPRELIKGLEAVSRLGHLTRDVLKSALALDWTENLLAYSDALLTGDLTGQLDVMNGWLAEPAEKARRLREFLLYLFNFEASTPRINDHVNAGFHLIAVSDRSRIAAALNARARSEGFRPASYWQQLLNFWLFDLAVIADDAALSIKLHEFHRLLTPQNARPEALTAATAPPPRKREFRSRSSRAISTAEADEAVLVHLSHRHIELLGDSGSFLGQHYGELFNVSAEIVVKATADTIDGAASQAITRVTHELGLRIQDWAGEKGTARCHWVYRNHRSSGMHRCLLAIHVPYEHIGAAEQWLAAKVWRVDGADDVTVTATWHNPQPRNTTAKQVSRLRFHWKRMRELFDALDPAIMHWDTDRVRKPLRQLLGLRPGGTASEPMGIKIVGASHSLGRRARKAAETNKMGLISAFRDGAWDQIDTGWELLEHRDRVAAASEREDQIRRVEYIGNETNALARKRYAEELEALHLQWPDDPRNRPRTWTPWWSARQVGDLDQTDQIQNEEH